MSSILKEENREDPEALAQRTLQRSDNIIFGRSPNHFTDNK